MFTLVPRLVEISETALTARGPSIGIGRRLE